MDSGRDVAVTGIGTVPFSAAPGRPFHDLAFEAARAALADAGIGRGELGSVVLAGLDVECGRTISNMYTAGAAGGHLRDEIRVADDGLSAAALAWMRVGSGLFDTTMVLAYGVSSEASPEQVHDLVFDPVHQRPFGLGRLLPLAMQAAAYQHRHPEAADAADVVAAANATAGAADPATISRGPSTREDVHRSPPSAPPLRRAHVGPLCDGVAALVLQPAALALRARRPPVRIMGFGWSSEGGELGARALEKLGSSADAARRAYRAAGIGPRDVARAEVHDVTAFHELMALEALGFAGPGEAPGLVTTGRAGPDAELRVNASGGSISGEPSVASGLYRLASCVRAVRGDGGGPSSPIALAHSTSGPAAQAACVGLVGRWDA